MKKIKLFMMLALLVAGVSNVFAGTATHSYDVTYVGVPESKTGNYTINTLYREYDLGFLGTWYQEGIDRSASTPTKIVMKNGAESGTPEVTPLTNDNYNTYFSPETITGYDYSVSIEGNQITITYTKTIDNYEDGDYIYSQYYWQSGQSSTRTKLPGKEIAIALNLNQTDYNVTEKYIDSRDRLQERTVTVQSSHLKDAVIPATVTIDGEVYTVTAIQKFGFNYPLNHQITRRVCPNTTSNPRTEEQKKEDGIYGQTVIDHNTGAYDDVDNINDHSNTWLETVTFENPDNIKYIGDYAFQSCTKLRSIIIPKNVEYLGAGVCSACQALTDVRFQVDNQTQRTKIKVLKNFSFWYCSALQTLELPDGIEEIEGQQYGAALQYMEGLTLIRLPNTLKTIGAHFLCCASSLKEVTIPASVTYIDGAAFHGCESLESVYLLGKAAALQKNAGRFPTFSENATLCKDHVSGCTFYTTPDYLESYQRDPVWSLIDEDGKDDGEVNDKNTFNTVYSNYANKLVAFQGEKRNFEGGKWVTAIFPHGVTDYKNSVFGAKTRVAIPDVNTHPTMSYGMDAVIYNVTFKLISSDDIPAATPVMFCPANTVKNYEMISISDYAKAGFKDEMTKDHVVHPQTAEDGANIRMKGWYQTHRLMPWDFYFMYKNKTVDENGNATYTDEDEKAMFYRVPEGATNIRVGATRCWWTISDATGVKISTNMSPDNNAKSMFFIDDETTGISNVETRINIEGIYDLQGRKIDVKQSDLPQGMYIVNGKKFIKK